MSDCQKDCPGFPAEKCGDKDKNLFMYIQMDGKVSGTIGGSQPTSSAEPSKTKDEPTEAQTVSTPSPARAVFRLFIFYAFLISMRTILCDRCLTSW